MSASKVQSYFVLADRGLKTAIILFHAGQMEDAALNVQQTVERIARALLTHAGLAFGTSHNLGQMALSLPKDHAFVDRIISFDDLSTAVTAFRYPTEGGRLKKAPAAETLKIKLELAETLVGDAKKFVYGENSKFWPAELVV